MGSAEALEQKVEQRVCRRRRQRACGARARIRRRFLDTPAAAGFPARFRDELLTERS